MSKKNHTTVYSAETRLPEPLAIDSPPPGIAELLDEIEKHLQDENPERALDVIARARSNSPWLTNAAAVCQLRKKNYSVAMTSFRSLVVGKGGILIRDDVPVAFKANFALSLFLVDNFDGASSLLAELRKEDHPAVLQLRTAFQQWKQGMSAWDRLKWKVAGLPPGPIAFDFPLGVLR